MKLLSPGFKEINLGFKKGQFYETKTFQQFLDNFLGVVSKNKRQNMDKIWT